MSERTLDHNTHDHNNRHLPLIILIICRTDLLLLKLNTLGYTTKVFWICRLTYLPVNRNDSHRQYSSAMITKTEMQISDSLTARHYCDVTKLINVNLAGMRDSYLLESMREYKPMTTYATFCYAIRVKIDQRNETLSVKKGVNRVMQIRRSVHSFCQIRRSTNTQFFDQIRKQKCKRSKVNW